MIWRWAPSQPMPEGARRALVEAYASVDWSKWKVRDGTGTIGDGGTMNTKARELELRTALSKIPLCGCGSSDAMWAIVEKILERAENHDKHGSFYDPMPDLELSGRAVEFAAQALDSSGMTEHGSGIGWAWLTEPGKLVLLFLRKYGHDRAKWPEYADTSSGAEEFSLSDEDWHKRTMSHGANLADATIP